MTRWIVGVLSVGMMVLGSGAIFGQTYPNKPIRIVTANVGGGADVLARMVSHEISGPLGQQVIVDNRVSVVAPEIVAKSAPMDIPCLYFPPNCGSCR